MSKFALTAPIVCLSDGRFALDLRQILDLAKLLSEAKRPPPGALTRVTLPAQRGGMEPAA